MLVVALCTASNSGSRVHSMKGGAKVIIEPHRHPGVFVARGKEDALVTLNMVPGKTVYGEKTVKVDDAEGKKVEYRVWNPFRSKLAAAIVGGVENIWMGPGSKVLYLGAASGTTVSHVSDLVGPVRSWVACVHGGVQSIGGETSHSAVPLQEGVVYAVEFSHRSGRDLINMAKNRPNVVPIIEDARHPLKYRMLVSMVDCVFADVAQPDQVRAPPSCGTAAPLANRVSMRAAGPYRVPQWLLLPQERRPLCDLHQGQLHRLHRARCCRVRVRAWQACCGGLQAPRTADFGAVRA